MKKAPDYIAVFQKIKRDQNQCWFYAAANGSFFSANGLGSCWQGIQRKPLHKICDINNGDIETITEADRLAFREQKSAMVFYR